MTKAHDAMPPIASDAALQDVRGRIERARSVADLWPDDPARGFGYDRLAPVLDHWAKAYDWRAAESRIRDLPWQIVGEGEHALRVVHQRASEPEAPVVVLLHGWPDSVLRFQRLLPLLDDMHVVVPALPGFPFALPTSRALSVDEIARSVANAMQALGYARYVVSGGDVGSMVAEIIAESYEDLVPAMHLIKVSPRHNTMVDPATLDEEARAYLQRSVAWIRAEGGYVAEQSTKPRTLAVGLGDSPAGLAAWLLEKIVDWSDDVNRSFELDDLVTWVCAYWFTGTIGTSFATYVEPAGPPRRTEVPAVVSDFAFDINPAPRSFVERVVNLHEFRTHATGGHFAAWEEPEAYAADLRVAVHLGQG